MVSSSMISSFLVLICACTAVAAWLPAAVRPHVAQRSRPVLMTAHAADEPTAHASDEPTEHSMEPLEVVEPLHKLGAVQKVVARPNPPSGVVLIIYTGGTLGMVKDHGSLSVEHQGGGLGRLIQSMPEFRDDQLPDIDMVEYEPLMDSSNIGPTEWKSIASAIGEHYYDYDGFVIVHGTDTMAYTASALSFMLEGLGKPVVLTGSIIPMCEPFNDARRNLIASLMFASQLELCEVAIFFNECLFRGNRAIKCDSTGLAAFTSPNFEPLATIGATVTTNRYLWLPQPSCRLRIHTNLAAKVVVVRLCPGFDDCAIDAIVKYSTKLDALVLSLYGTGNGPSHKKGFVETIQEATRRGILVVATTQCQTGSVMLDVYEVGQRLLDAGVVSAGDMTTEACVTKISYLCGRGLRGETLRQAMAQDLRGELSPTNILTSDQIGLTRSQRL